MIAFLVIYHKRNKVVSGNTESVMSDFTLSGERTIIKKEFPGLILCVASRFEKSISETEQAISFVSGHISFEKTDVILEESTAQKFAWCLQKNLQEILPKLEGAFTALHYNVKEHVLTIVNDKFGIFPLFIFEDENYVILSSEYQPLFQLHSKKSRQLDGDAIAEFFTLGTTLGNKTFFRNIKNFPAASYALISEKGFSSKIYWSDSDILKTNASVDHLAKEIFNTFKKINQEYSDAGLTDLCLLSAGADSRLILSTLTREQLKASNFFTSNLSFLSATEDKDVIGAEAIAKKFNLNHRVEKISFYENEFTAAFFDLERKPRNHHVYGGWHGGEFLGGLGLNASPIKQDLMFKDVDPKLKSIFCWHFRWNLKDHPYKTYLKEKNKFAASHRNILFMVEQFTRSFFTSIYGGTRGYWAQPHQLTHHGFSPFWDSRFIKLLLTLPEDLLENYYLYNEVFKLCRKEFTELPSNSPLTTRQDSVIPAMTIGIEPKSRIPETHHNAYLSLLQNEKTWKRKFYNEKKLKEILTHEPDPLTIRWVDFETWYAAYII